MFTNNNNPSTCWINDFSSKANVQCGIVNNEKASSTYSHDDNTNIPCKTSLNLDIIDFIQSWELLKMMTCPKRQFNTRSSTQPFFNSIPQHCVIKQEEEEIVFFNNQCINNHDEMQQQLSTYNQVMNNTSTIIPPPTITSHQQMTFNTSSPLNTFQNNRVNTISNHDDDVNDGISSLDKATISNLETYQFPMIKNPYIDQHLPTTVTNNNTFVTNNTTTTTSTTANTTFHSSFKINNNQIRKVSNNCKNKSDKRKTSIYSSTTTTTTSNLSSIGNNSSCTSSTRINCNNNCNVLQSNPKHLKRRRKYKKRKNSSMNANPAQSQMEFHFPIWTFHME